MPQITRDSLLTLEAYHKARPEFRAKVMAHKKNRAVPLGNNMTLVFEDELTIRYQIQEILRVEKAFQDENIRDELEAYNPLVPDGSNWKATMMIEYPDETERKQMLSRLKGVENQVWVQVMDYARVYAIADEDLERENAEKTSSVHFLRFELSADMIASVKSGAALAMGVAHPAYKAETIVSQHVRDSLKNDLT